MAGSMVFPKVGRRDLHLAVHLDEKKADLMVVLLAVL
jgi:hypothetical protein